MHLVLVQGPLLRTCATRAGTFPALASTMKRKEQHAHPAATARGHAHQTKSYMALLSPQHHSRPTVTNGRSTRADTMPLYRFASFNNTLRSKPDAAAMSTPDLRPYPPACLGESNARRLLKRSQLSKKATREAEGDEEAIFAVQEEATLEAVAAAAMSALPIYSRPTGYSVQCYATHAEDAARRREAVETEREKLVLFRSINSARHAEGQGPLRLKPALSKYAQDHADATSTTGSGPSYLFPTNNAFSTSNSSPTLHPNSVVVVMAPSGAREARLVSPPRMGALACGELWYGGKYRRHLYDMSDKASAQHPDDCPCHLRMVFETMVDEGWRAIGIGRGEDGRWVVELGQ